MSGVATRPIPPAPREDAGVCVGFECEDRTARSRIGVLEAKPAEAGPRLGGSLVCCYV